MKLTQEEQIKRIQQILKHDNVIICPDCGLEYVAFSKDSEVECPQCKNKTIPKESDFQEDFFDEEIISKYKPNKIYFGDE